MGQADQQEGPEALRRQQTDRNECGERRANGEHGPQRPHQIGQASGRGSGDEADGRAGGEQNAELLRRQPTRFEERRHERRRDTEPRIEQRVQRDEAPQRTHQHRLITRRRPEQFGDSGRASRLSGRRSRLRAS
jgi:hypothetical protein